VHKQQRKAHCLGKEHSKVIPTSRTLVGCSKRGLEWGAARYWHFFTNLCHAHRAKCAISIVVKVCTKSGRIQSRNKWQHQLQTKAEGSTRAVGADDWRWNRRRGSLVKQHSSRIFNTVLMERFALRAQTCANATTITTRQGTEKAKRRLVQNHNT